MTVKRLSAKLFSQPGELATADTLVPDTAPKTEVPEETSKKKSPKKNFTKLVPVAPGQDRVPIVSKTLLLEYAMAAAKQVVQQQYPKADFQLKGWSMLFLTIARTAEYQYDIQTHQNIVPLRVALPDLRRACVELATKTLEEAVKDSDFRKMSGLPALKLPEDSMDKEAK